MLPQTRIKLRWFSLISLVVGCVLLLLIWISASPEIVVKGAKLPTFFQVLLSQGNAYDEVQWKLMDLTVDFEFFSNLLRAVLLLTVFTSALSIMVVLSDIRLTKK